MPRELALFLKTKRIDVLTSKPKALGIMLACRQLVEATKETARQHTLSLSKACGTGLAQPVLQLAMPNWRDVEMIAMPGWHAMDSLEVPVHAGGECSRLSCLGG